MKKENDINKQVEATLNSLDGIQPASPGIFFYTRVLARLDRAEKNIWEKITALIGHPAVAVTMVIVVVSMNMIVAVHQQEAPSPLVEQSEQSNYDEFNVAANTFYDTEIPEP